MHKLSYETSWKRKEDKGKKYKRQSQQMDFYTWYGKVYPSKEMQVLCLKVDYIVQQLSEILLKNIWHIFSRKTSKKVLDSNILKWSEVKFAPLCPTLCDPMEYSPWNSPGQNTGVDSFSLL